MVKKKKEDKLTKAVKIITIVTGIILALVAIIGLISSLMNTTSKYAELKISKNGVDIVKKYQFENFFDNPIQRIKVRVVNIGQSNSGTINLCSMDEGIFYQSFSSFLPNLVPGGTNTTEINFEANLRELLKINKFPQIKEIPIRVRCTGCEKTKIEYIPICIYNTTEEWNECKKYDNS